MALPNLDILVGAPPLLWSNVHEAFEKINQNFEALDLATGGSAVDLSSLYSSVSPATDDSYNLGTDTNRWKKLYVGEWSNTDAGLENGVWLGSAHIKGIDGVVDLPNNSTVNGSLIIDPEKTFFKTIDVNNNLSVVATDFGSTVNFLEGDGISLIVDSGGNSIEFTNTGILDINDGDGIIHTTVAGVATIVNDGVRSFFNVASLPSGRTLGAGINISATKGDDIKITNTGVLTITAGVGITVSTDAASGEVQITNSAPVVNSFAQIQINGDTLNKIQADAVSDILNINSGQGITLTKNTLTDTLTITVDPVFDLTGDVLGNVTGNVLGNVTGNVLGNVTGDTEGYHTGDVKGSVFGDDSTKIVDAVENKVYASGGFFGDLTGGSVSATTLRTSETIIALGSLAGNTNQGASSVAIGGLAGVTDQGVGAVGIGAGAGNDTQGISAIAIGYGAGQQTQGTQSVAIGESAGGTNQGDNAVAIGLNAGSINQGARSIAIGANAGNGGTFEGSIILNAGSSPLTSAAAGFYVAPIRSTANGSPMMYDASTKELTYSSALTFTGSTIDTSDSSGITVVVQTTFNTDVTVENDLNVTQQLNVAGSRVINLAQLQEVVAASADFTDFQARIAALV